MTEKVAHPDPEGFIGMCAHCDWAVFDTEPYVQHQTTGAVLHKACIDRMVDVYGIIAAKGNGKGKG